MTNLVAARTLGLELAAFQRAFKMNDRDLAAWLDLDAPKLALLREYPWPDPSSSLFHQQCQEIARRTGCDAWALGTALRRLGRW